MTPHFYEGFLFAQEFTMHLIIIRVIVWQSSIANMQRKLQIPQRRSQRRSVSRYCLAIRITYYQGFALHIAKHYPPADHGDLTEK